MCMNLWAVGESWAGVHEGNAGTVSEGFREWGW